MEWPQVAQSCECCRHVCSSLGHMIPSVCFFPLSLLATHLQAFYCDNAVLLECKWGHCSCMPLPSP